MSSKLELLLRIFQEEIDSVDDLDPRYAKKIRELDTHLVKIANIIKQENFLDEDVLVDNLNRNLHTLKGVYRLFGLNIAAHIIHKIEEVIGNFRRINKIKKEINSKDITPYIQEEWKKVIFMTQKYERNEKIEENELNWITKNHKRLTEHEGLFKSIQFNLEEKQINQIINKTINLRLSKNNINNHLNAMKTQMNVFKQKYHNKEIKNEYELNFYLNHLFNHFEEQSLKLQNEINKQEQDTQTLLNQLLKTRVISLNKYVDRFQQVVKMACKELNKDAVLKIPDEHIKIDKQVIDKLIPAIEHILRNSVAHGIESNKNDRKERKKNAIGNITLNIKLIDSHIAIEIKDDGQGINWQKIKENGIKMGFLQDNKEYNINQLKEIMFKSGITTSDNVNMISGRGVGLDVVQNILEEIGGHITVDSKQNEYTTFILTFPIEQSINNVLIIKQNNRFYGIPNLMIEQIYSFNKTDYLNKIKNKEKINLNNEELQLVHLSNIINEPYPLENKRHFKVLVLKYLNQKMALFVDEVAKNMEVQIRKMGKIQKTNGILGAAILSNGEKALILNPISIMNSILDSHEPTQKQEAYCLIVDDSKAVCMIEQKSLAKINVNSIAKEDGLSALNYIKDNLHNLPKVIITDYEMPNMNGFELVNELKNMNETQNLPIVMITSKSLENYQKSAEKMGINLVLGKPFNEDVLHQFIKQYI